MPLNIFITGGTSGIGLAIAELYNSNGHNVGVCGRDEEKFKDITQNIKCFKVDVTKREELKSALDEFTQNCKLDIVIASAGLSFSKKTQIPNFEISRKIIDLNINGVLNTFELSLEKMLPNKQGQLVAIASVAGLCGFPGVSTYSASKAAVIKLCEGYNVDLRPLGIYTTCIAPGFVDTPLTQKNHHKMPFLVDAKVAARNITKAIEKKKSFYTFPFIFSRILIFLSIIPRSFYLFLMKFYKFDYAKESK